MKKIFLYIGIAVLSIFGISLFVEFMANHTYYKDMFASRANWKIILWAGIATMIPIRHIAKTKNFSLKKFFVWILPAGLLLFSLAMTIVKDGIVGGSAGFIILCVNTLILYFLGMYFILGALALGTWISQKIVAFKEHRRQEMMINFGLGLGAILLLVYVLTMAKALFPVLIRIIFLGLGAIVRYMRGAMKEYASMITDIFSGFQRSKIKHNWPQWIGLVLMGVAIMYYFYGFNLSFIPYSTAWDANHAYMYVPKILAENGGVLWGDATSPAAVAPYLRHMFITFWFSLIQPIKSRFWLAPDTIAVAMNFLSGMFVLIFGIGMTQEALHYFRDSKTSDEDTKTSLAFGWTGMLLWLTSGMGAFLVFVDNKTDLGVLAMTILALLSGFIFLRVVHTNHQSENKLHKDALKYVVISGFMFSLASLSKPTAFIDIALFGLLVVALWIDQIIALGLGFIILGATGIIQMGNAADMMNPLLGKYVMLIGVLIVALGLGKILRKQSKQFRASKKYYVHYLLIWVATILAMILIFKGPNIVIKGINDHNISPMNVVKGLLIGEVSTPELLLASTTGVNNQTTIDQSALNQTTKTMSVAACKTQTFSSGDLTKDIKKPITTNEDVGRYVGYGWKQFDRAGLSIGYFMLRIVYPINDKCYGTNHDAKLLCTSAKAIDAFDITTIKRLFAQVHKDSKAYTLLSGAIATYNQKIGSLTGTFNPNEFRDQIVSLRQYYQNHTIYAEAGKINVPYRYIIPLNVVFNRSLQNLSNYYTDIGFIRLPMLLFMLMGFVYAVLQKDKNLSALTGTTIMGWTIWWIVGGGIVWYGIGLIVWTILSVVLFVQALIQDPQTEERKQTISVFLLLFVFWVVVQLLMNFIRISSQGGGGPFMRYKMSNGKTVELSDQLQQTETIQSAYGWKSVFDIQFPHYNKFINYVKNRDNTDGVLIAGTYIQYFLDNQHNVRGDGMLDRFREQTSDNNLCKSYQRLHNNNIKYLVIDPNIGTVVMGEGNESLFNRFFAKRDAVSGKLLEHGAITRLVQLWKAGYINLFSTNNLGAKYAFTLSDEVLQGSFGITSPDDILLIRAKLAIARFFPEAQQLITFIADIFGQRIMNGQAVADIADIYGKDIDETKVRQLAQAYLAKTDVSADIKNLSQDERLILAQYLGLYNMLSSQNAQYQEYLNSLLGQSLGGGSQLMVFELK